MTIHYDPRAAEAKRQAALRDAFANAQPQRIPFGRRRRISERAYFWTLVTVVTLAAAFTLALT